MKAAMMLMRREYWEHRGRFFWLPVVIFGLFMLASLIIGIAVGGGFSAAHPSGVADTENVARLGFGIGFIFYILFSLSCIAYFVSCLSEDRVDKSVLFWRSLPVSDTKTVLAKVGAFALLGTAITLAALIITHLLVLFALACMASARGAAGFTVFTSFSALVGTWALYAWAMLLNALWWLPYIGWLLIISSIFRKRTWIFAILPPIIVGFAEQIISTIFTAHTSSHFFSFITRHLVTSPAYPFGGAHMTPTNLVGASHHGFLAYAGEITHYLALPSMWIGVGIGIVLITGATVIRRYSATA